MKPMSNIDLIYYDRAFERRLERLAKQKEADRRHAQQLQMHNTYGYVQAQLRNLK
jgi:hypothetical protein